MTAPAPPGSPGSRSAPGPVPLAEIAERAGPLRLEGDPSGVVIRRVTYDHRKVEPGALHCCLPGGVVDGRQFAADARRAGAVAFVSETALGAAAGGLPQLVTGPGAARSAMAHAACVVFGDPAGALLTLGVTGTNGKTTTTYLLRSVLEAHGWPTAVIGTLAGPRTTPEAPELQASFREAVAGGRAAVALEVTSHALSQHRVDGYRHDVAVFTNLSRDHLDYHGSMEAYFGAKARLFTPEHARLGVVNADDDFGRRLLDRSEIDTVGFSLGEATDVEDDLGEVRFVLEGRKVRIRPGGLFNVRNALAAAAAARALGVGSDEVAEGLSGSVAPSGRLEAVENKLGATIVVDYAHTPAALEAVLTAASMATRDRGRIVVVFGCGGGRDAGKRAEMGAVASRLADIAFVTSDNPRDEDPSAIIADVVSGADGPADVVVEPDRRKAIELAVAALSPGDALVVAGKGHETTQEVAGRLLAFDDRDAVAVALGDLDGAP